jgi:hypothetical protein
MRNPDMVELLVHPDGVTVPELESLYQNRRPHDPSNLHEARRLAEPDGKIRLGVFYRNEDLPVYDEVRSVPVPTGAEKVALLNQELDRYAV